jgi:hypothetical protein
MTGTLLGQLLLLSQLPTLGTDTPPNRLGEAPDSCRIIIEHVADLGALTDPASVIIPLNVDIARVPWGGWLVTEDGNQILEYAEDGSFRRFFGRRGQGPGDLAAPNAVEVDPADSVWVSNRRGRSVVYDVGGRVGRTVVEPGFQQVVSFTPSGFPITLLVKVKAGREPRPEIWPYVQVWDREGHPLHQLGPGAMLPDTAQVRVVGVGSPPHCAVTGDSVLRFPLSGQRAFVRWTPTSADTVPFPSSNWIVLGFEEGHEPLPGEGVVALAPDQAGGFWALGRIRRLSEIEEDRLTEEAPRPGIETGESFRRSSAAVRNAVYDGWLGYMTDEGEVTEAGSFKEYPWGFSGPGEFFTFDEHEDGLIRIRVWRFRRSCSPIQRPGTSG